MRDLFGSGGGETDSGTLEGVVDRVVFSNPDSGWAVIRLRDAGGAVHTAVGRLLGVQPGEQLRLEGGWERDRKFGPQFRAASYLSLQPETRRGIERFLGSGMIPGIGKVMAQRLVRSFGEETLEVIESQPERLAEVPGIGPKRAGRIVEAWRRHSGLKNTMIFLQTHGISAAYAARIHRHFGDDAVTVVRNHPYRLAAERIGIGFKSADRVAASLGFAPQQAERVEAGVLYLLSRAADDGHLYLPRGQLLERAAELLEVEASVVEPAVRELVARGEVVRREVGPGQDDALYPAALARAEEGVAQRVLTILAGPPPAGELEVASALDAFERRLEIALAARQRQAVGRALSSKLVIVTGGPGTGKTTLVRAIVEILRREKRRVALAAPTGRAAKRLAEATGEAASTIHRLLEFDPRRMVFKRGPDRPLEADMLIVDEASMLDCVLTHQLLSAVPERCQVVLVGDVDQLPSVGPGSVLADLLRCGRIPVVRLRQVFRQAARSRIVVNAHRILRGELPLLEGDGQTSDFFFFARQEPESVLETLRHLVLERIPRGFALDPRRDIQLLAPMRRGLLGVENLNLEIQGLLNPSGEPVPGSRRLRAGDRVMQVRNNYEMEVFNGDVGRIEAVHAERRRLRVAFDDRRVEYRFADLDQLTLAYACSVHKAQGSEYPCVVVPVHTQHYVMLQRNLLYTAVTRGRRLVVLVGERRALAVAVRNDRLKDRFTGLFQRLADGPAEAADLLRPPGHPAAQESQSPRGGSGGLSGSGEPA